MLLRSLLSEKVTLLNLAMWKATALAHLTNMNGISTDQHEVFKKAPATKTHNLVTFCAALNAQMAHRIFPFCLCCQNVCAKDGGQNYMYHSLLGSCFISIHS